MIIVAGKRVFMKITMTFVKREKAEWINELISHERDSRKDKSKVKQLAASAAYGEEVMEGSPTG